MSKQEESTIRELSLQVLALCTILVLTAYPIIAEHIPILALKFNEISIIGAALSVIVMTICLLHIDSLSKSPLLKVVGFIPKPFLYSGVLVFGVLLLVGWLNLNDNQSDWYDEKSRFISELSEFSLNLMLLVMISLGLFYCSFATSRGFKWLLSSSQTMEARAESDVLNWSPEVSSTLENWLHGDLTKINEKRWKQLETLLRNKFSMAVQTYDMSLEFSNEFWSFEVILTRLATTVHSDLKGNHKWPDESNQKILALAKRSTISSSILSNYRNRYLKLAFSDEKEKRLTGQVVARIIRLIDENHRTADFSAPKNAGRFLMQALCKESILEREDKGVTKGIHFKRRMEVLMSYIYALHYQGSYEGILNFRSHEQKRLLMIDLLNKTFEKLELENHGMVSTAFFFGNTIPKFELPIQKIVSPDHLNTIRNFVWKYDSNLYLAMEDPDPEVDTEIGILLERVANLFLGDP